MAKRIFFLFVLVILGVLCVAAESDCDDFVDLPQIFFKTHTYETHQVDQSSCQKLCIEDSSCKAYAWSSYPIQDEISCASAARPCCYLKLVGPENLTISVYSSNFHSGFKPGCSKDRDGYLNLSPSVYNFYTNSFAERIGNCNASSVDVATCQNKCLNTPTCSLYSWEPCHYGGSTTLPAGVECEAGKPCCYMYNINDESYSYIWVDQAGTSSNYHSGLKFACEYTGVEGYVFEGEDMNIIFTGLNACQKICCEDPECKLYSWHTGECHLKNKISSKYQKRGEGHYSAIKSDAAKDFTLSTANSEPSTPDLQPSTPDSIPHKPVTGNAIPYIEVRVDMLAVAIALPVVLIIGLSVMLYRARKLNNNKPYVMLDNLKLPQ